MGCTSPYSFEWPYQGLGTNNPPGTKGLDSTYGGFCFCNDMSPCTTIWGYVGNYSLGTSVNCCSPCNDGFVPFQELGEPAAQSQWQCAKRATPYGGIYSSSGYGLSGYNGSFDPLGFRWAILTQYPWVGWDVGGFSVAFDFTDMCCATTSSLTSPWVNSPFVASKSGKIKIYMANWELKVDWGYPRWTPPEELTKTGHLFIPNAAGRSDTWPYQGCGVFVKPFCTISSYDPLPPECILSTDDFYAVVSVFVVDKKNCTHKRYVGYDEVEVAQGDVFYFDITYLPLNIPTFENTFFGVTVPGQTIPFTIECSESSDCVIYTYIRTFCLIYRIQGIYPAPAFAYEHGCSNGQYIPPAFRKKQLQRQVLSRIKKMH